MYIRCTVGGRINNDVEVELRCNTNRDGEGRHLIGIALDR